MKKLDYTKKPLIAMLHLKGDSKMLEIMIRETNVYYENGIDAVLAENYLGSESDCKKAPDRRSRNYPDRLYGVNILGDYRLAFRMAKDYGASFVQIDSVCGHLSPRYDENYAKMLIEDEKDRTFDVSGGLRFKYQPILSGRTLTEDSQLSKQRCDAVVTTGVGTGNDTPTKKIAGIT